MPQVVGRSFTDAAGALAEFKVERIETASAAPAGEVLAQEPAPATPGRPGSTVILQVSDGSLAGATSASPVTTPAAAAADSSTPAPVASLAAAPTPVPLPPQEPIDPPGARGQSPTAFPAIAALMFGAGVSLGLLSGALLMRRWLLRGKLAVGESAPPPTLPRRRQPVDQRPVDSDAGGLPESDTSPEIRFTAWLIPVATTIVLAPRSAAGAIHSRVRSTARLEQVRLLAPIEVSGDCIERALFERTRNEAAFAQAFEPLRGGAADRAAAELNRVLDVDILDVLAQGWVQVPAMHDAVQLSAVTRGPSVLVDVDVRHTIASTSYVVLDTRLAGSPLPPLELSLEIVVDVQSATLAACEGGIELVALGEATVLARLKDGSALMKEHVTEISWTPCDPSGPRPHAPERPASVDFPI